MKELPTIGQTVFAYSRARKHIVTGKVRSVRVNTDSSGTTTRISVRPDSICNSKSPHRQLPLRLHKLSEVAPTLKELVDEATTLGPDPTRDEQAYAASVYKASVDYIMDNPSQGITDPACKGSLTLMDQQINDHLIDNLQGQLRKAEDKVAALEEQNTALTEQLWVSTRSLQQAEVQYKRMANLAAPTNLALLDIARVVKHSQALLEKHRDQD